MIEVVQVQPQEGAAGGLPEYKITKHLPFSKAALIRLIEAAQAFEAKGDANKCAQEGAKWREEAGVKCLYWIWANLLPALVKKTTWIENLSTYESDTDVYAPKDVFTVNDLAYAVFLVYNCYDLWEAFATKRITSLKNLPEGVGYKYSLANAAQAGAARDLIDKLEDIIGYVRDKEKNDQFMRDFLSVHRAHQVAAALADDEKSTSSGTSSGGRKKKRKVSCATAVSKYNNRYKNRRVEMRGK